MKLIKITLLSLLSTSIGLQAAVLTTGCWMPESEKVKNHYKGKDGGYVAARIIYGRSGASPLRDYYLLRLKGKYVEGSFIPAGFSTLGYNEPAKEEPIKDLFKKYWPHIKQADYYIYIERKKQSVFKPDDIFHSAFKPMEFVPCYINTTDAAFERWKKKYPYKQEIAKHKQEIAKHKKEIIQRKQEAEDKREQEKKRKQQKRLQELHN